MPEIIRGISDRRKLRAKTKVIFLAVNLQFLSKITVEAKCFTKGANHVIVDCAQLSASELAGKKEMNDGNHD